MNSSAKSSFDMSRLCQPKCWKMLHIVISLFSSFCFFLIKRCFATPQLDPEQLLRDALAGHSQCRAGPVFQVFYELHSHSGFRLNLIWLEWPRCQNDRNTLEGAMVARNMVLLVQGVTCQISTPSPWRHESNPQPTHSKSWHLKTLFQLLRFNPFLGYGPLK